MTHHWVGGFQGLAELRIVTAQFVVNIGSKDTLKSMVGKVVV